MSEATLGKLRPEQQEYLARLADQLAALTDAQLDELTMTYKRRIFGTTNGRPTDSESVWDDPVSRTEMRVCDLLIVEGNHRRLMMAYAEADMNGGHNVWVGLADDRRMYYAYCLPYEHYCWEGPARQTVEEAIRDGREHHPGYEPTVWPLVAEEGDL